jgi:hypothetical protein
LDSIAPSSVSPQPFLVSEKRPKRDSELPVLIALVSGRKSAGARNLINMVAVTVVSCAVLLGL